MTNVLFQRRNFSTERFDWLVKKIFFIQKPRSFFAYAGYTTGMGAADARDRPPIHSSLKVWRRTRTLVYASAENCMRNDETSSLDNMAFTCTVRLMSDGLPDCVSKTIGLSDFAYTANCPRPSATLPRSYSLLSEALSGLTCRSTAPWYVRETVRRTY